MRKSLWRKEDGVFRRRKLGVPCVVNRLIQQALLQVLQKHWGPTFSEYSYGFRPGRSAHQAVAQAQAYIAEGYGYVVDLDLERFFDRVNHDKLMARVADRTNDLSLRGPNLGKRRYLAPGGAFVLPANTVVCRYRDERRPA